MRHAKIDSEILNVLLLELLELSNSTIATDILQEVSYGLDAKRD